MSNKSRLLAGWLIVGTILLTVALYFAPKENISDKMPGNAGTAESNDEQSLLKKARHAFETFMTTEDDAERKNRAQEAIQAFEKVLEINPENLDAKSDLGFCYAVVTEDPMRGIMMLREVVEKNPRHEQAQFNLGLLSLQSGQYDKALERFNTVLSINPDNKDAKALKAEAEKMKNK